MAVPSTGVYYGTRDIIKRMLLMGTTASATGGGSGVHLNEVALAVTAAFVADVVSLIVRAPADTLALRLQSATGQESLQVHHRKQQHKQQKQQQQKPPILLQDHSLSEMDDGDTLLLLQEQLDYYNTSDITQEQLELAELRVEKRVGNWFLESLERLPAIILTDLPYLLSRIALNTYLLQGHAVVNVGLYEGTALVSALLCAFCTTPFDVVRTRILVEHDDENDGSRKGLIETFQAVVKEGDGGIRNLFAGWLERTLYLGISSLWLPFALVGYMAIRDAILLQVFE